MVTNENELKQAIADVAYKKFSQHGFKKVTMDEIASELTISKKTVYKHFDSKEAILEDLVNQRLKRGKEVLDSLLADQGPVDERIKRVAEIFPRFLDPEWQRLITDVVHSVPWVAKKIQAILNYFITEVARKVLKEGQKQGTVRKDLNVDLFTVAYLGAAKELLNSDFLTTHPITEDLIPKQLLKIFMEGVLVRK